jgi:hypothetical protein
MLNFLILIVVLIPHVFAYVICDGLFLVDRYYLYSWIRERVSAIDYIDNFVHFR